MRKFELYKTIQLILYLAVTAAALYVIFGDSELYAAIAREPHIRLLALLLWAGLGVSFVFLLFDFGSYADLRRENTELDQAVRSDALTGVANRYSCDAYIGRYLHRELPANMACVTLDLTNLKEINAAAGHSGGDEVIRRFSDVLVEAFREERAALRGRKGRGAEDDPAGREYFIGRNGGNKFLVILKNASPERVEACLRTVKRLAAGESAAGIPVDYRAGAAYAAEDGVESITDLVALSDRRTMA